MYQIIPEPKLINITSNKKSNFKSIKLANCPLNDIAKNDFLSFYNFDISENANIFFITDESIKPEGYKIVIKDGIINIYYNKENGAFYALQTLKQLLHQGKMELEELEILDYPSYPYRGFMLDVGRYFYDIKDVKTIIDRMALHKLNMLHFHLTEDQGWRIEIKKYPILTEKGSIRNHTNFNHTPHGGFYTQEQIKDIVNYCHSKFIKVMPEFDVPGHSRAAIACFPELACFPRELEVATHWGVKKDVLCAGKESTYRFIFNVIDELCELFPDKIFHIGGDEVPKHRWCLCPECQKVIKENKLKDETQLQEFFMNKIYDHLKSKGFEVFMWNYDKLNPEILYDDIGFTLCGGECNGRKCIDTSSSAYYLDLPYGYISLEDTCNHKIPEGAIGAEVQMWTEYIPNMAKSDSMMYPRMGAMVETCWSGTNNYENFAKKLDTYYSYLDRFNINYSKGNKKINPKGLNKTMSIALFERRQLDWEGLTILIDNKKVERIAKKNKKSANKR